MPSQDQEGATVTEVFIMAMDSQRFPSTYVYLYKRGIVSVVEINKELLDTESLMADAWPDDYEPDESHHTIIGFCHTLYSFHERRDNRPEAAVIEIWPAEYE